MLIQPTTITMSRYHLEALLAASSARLKALKGDTPTRRVLEDAVDHLADKLARATGQED